MPKIPIIWHIITLLLLVCAASGQNCPLIDASRQSQSNWGLPNCTFFRPNACCSLPEVELALGASMAQAGIMMESVDSQPEFATRKCRNHLDFLMCYFCSPLQKGWTDNNGKVTACLGFCNRVYYACQHASWRGTEIGDLFANGKALCEAQNFAVLAVGTDGFDFDSLLNADKGSCFGITSELNQLVGAADSALRPGALVLALGVLGTLFLTVTGDEKPLAGFNLSLVLLMLSLLGMLQMGTAEVAVAAASCPYYNYRQVSAQWGLTNCSWFKPASCCLPGEEAALVASIDATSDLLYHTSIQCQQVMNFVGCWPCNPEQATFFDALQQRLTVCSRFCAHMFDSCKDSMWGGKKVGETFANGITFCTGLRFEVRDSSCLDLPETVFIADKWCDIPVDPLKSAASRDAVPARGVRHIFLLTLAVTLYILRGDGQHSSSRPESRQRRGTSCTRTSHGGGSTQLLKVALGLLCTLIATHAAPIPESTVARWSAAIGNDLSSLASNALRASEAQRIYNNANYTVTDMDGDALVADLRTRLQGWFKTKEEAVLRLKKQVEEDIKGALYILNDKETLEVPKFRDRDNILDIPGLAYDDRFKSNVTQVVSLVKVPQGVYQQACGNGCGGGLASLPQDARKHIKVSDGLEARVMKANLANDPSLRWQFVGFKSGVHRQFPGKPSAPNHLGVPLDYDPRLRPWYLSAVSAPKDIVIIIDCSYSMQRGGRFQRAKAATKVLLKTLSKSDYVNVICASGPHMANCCYMNSTTAGVPASKQTSELCCNTKCREFFPRNTRTLGCLPDVMFPATSSVVNDLTERMGTMLADGSKDLFYAVQMADRLLNQNQRTGCQSLIIILTGH